MLEASLKYTPYISAAFIYRNHNFRARVLYKSKKYGHELFKQQIHS